MLFHFRSIRWRIALAYVTLILAIMAGLTIFLTRQVRTLSLRDLQGHLFTETKLIANSGELIENWQNREALQLAVDRWSTLVAARITAIDQDGTVLADSHADGTQMDNHLNQPEVQNALASGEGSAIRLSRTVGETMLFTAVPVRSQTDAPVTGILRLALPLSQVNQSADSLRNVILIAGAIATILTALLSILIAERTVRPVRRLTEVAGQMSQGDLSVRMIPSTQDEIGQLTRAFNRMVETVQEQMQSLSREQERLTTVLNKMADGMLILEGEGYVQLINPAAARLLQVNRETALGLSLPQVVRDHRIVSLWQKCQEADQEQTETLEWDRYSVQIMVTPFWDGLQRGYLLTIQDLTQLRRLETVRRDFVSNISHELRTPLASLRALVETLRDGALDDPPAAQRFLDRIETEVDALAQMVQELLELSRIESGQVPLHLQPAAVSEIILPPVERLQPQAERAQVDLVIDLPAGLPSVQADAVRMHQVVTNLVHNAIKFTAAGGTITVQAKVEKKRAGQQVIISVNDTGVGIPAEDLPRIFERFYKADRARSGGGTGLGLAISKHIVQAHDGRIWAESSREQGSTFYFSLPVVN